MRLGAFFTRLFFVAVFAIGAYVATIVEHGYRSDDTRYRAAPTCPTGGPEVCRGWFEAAVTSVVDKGPAGHVPAQMVIDARATRGSDTYQAVFPSHSYGSNHGWLSSLHPGDPMRVELWRTVATRVEANGRTVATDYLPSSEKQFWQWFVYIAAGLAVVMGLAAIMALVPRRRTGAR